MISLLKIKGLQATVMACAAFCIPISMTKVRRSLVVKRNNQAINAPQEVVARISKDIVRPRLHRLGAFGYQFEVRRLERQAQIEHQ